MCADPLDGRRVDPLYADEAAAISRLGLGYDLLDVDALVNDGDAERAVRRVRAAADAREAREASEADEAVYRGWMLRLEQYDQLWRALIRRGVRLVNDPAAYGAVSSAAWLVPGGGRAHAAVGVAAWWS